MRALALRVLAVVVASASAIFAVSTNVSCAADPAPAVADAGATMTIALLQSLNGTEQAIGIPLKQAAEVAQRQINAGGGILGQRVILDVKDNKSDVGVAQANADAVLSSSSVIAIGPTASPEAVQMVPKLVAGHILTISSTVVTSDLTNAEPPHNRFFFRTLPPADVHGRVAAVVMATPAAVGAPIAACKNVAVVQADDAYGNPYTEAFITRYAELGGKVVVRVKIPTDQKGSYEAEIDQVIAAQPLADCVALICYNGAGAGFMLDYRKKTALDVSRDWTKVQVIGGNALYSQAFIDKATVDRSNPDSQSASEGVYGILVDPAPETSEYTAFARMYRASASISPSETIPRNTANTYDALILAALAIQKAGSTIDSVAIRNALFDVSRGMKPGAPIYGPDQIPEALDALRRGLDIDYNGASGNVNFDDNGNVKEDMIVWQVKSKAECGPKPCLRKVGVSLKSDKVGE